jgi:hypothetical protein
MFIGQQCNLQQKICKDMSNSEHEIEIVSNTKKLTMIVLHLLSLALHEFSMDNHHLDKNLYISMNMSIQCLTQIHSLL